MQVMKTSDLNPEVQTPITPRTVAPFRADHVGSLLRPAELKTARRQRESGDISAADLDALENSAIQLLIAKQQIQDPGLQSSDRINFVPANQTKEPAREQIQQRAYELFIERGCEQGRDIEDWLGVCLRIALRCAEFA